MECVTREIDWISSPNDRFFPKKKVSGKKNDQFWQRCHVKRDDARKKGWTDGYEPDADYCRVSFRIGNETGTLRSSETDFWNTKKKRERFEWFGIDREREKITLRLLWALETYIHRWLPIFVRFLLSLSLSLAVDLASCNISDFFLAPGASIQSVKY